jgi:hypothetical protein
VLDYLHCRKSNVHEHKLACHCVRFILERGAWSLTVVVVGAEDHWGCRCSGAAMIKGT